MGRGIAHVAALSGFNTILCDLSDDLLLEAVRLISLELQRGVEKGKISPEAASAASSSVRTSVSFEPLSRCGAVIEAALEDAALKKRIFLDLEKVCPPDALLATNTSSLSI